MKILFLAAYLPYSPRASDKVRPHHWLKYLSKRHEISLVSFIESENERQYVKEISRYCAGVEIVLRQARRGLFYRALNLFQQVPYFVVGQFASSQMRERIRHVLEKGCFDLVHVSTLGMAQYAFDIHVKAKVLDEVDCLTRNCLQVYNFAVTPRNKILSYIDWIKTKHYEPRAVARFDTCIVANPHDKEFLLKLTPRSVIEAIPNGVDLEFFSPQTVADEYPSLILVGPLHYTPNADALLYFCSQILPLVEKKYPRIKLYVIGKSAVNSPRLKTIISSKENIISTGFVEDVRLYLAKASVFICPLRIGTGIKTKVLEALAMGKAVVSSSIGIEGINVTPGKDILLADEPVLFSQNVIKLLDNAALRQEMGANARKRIEEFHNWQERTLQLENIYYKIISAKP